MLFILFSLFHTASAKCIRASSKTFTNAVKKTPITLVLFTSNKCIPCRRINTVMDTISERYTDSIGFLVVEFETSSDIPFKYNIMYAPTIAVFRGGEFKSIYYGEWSSHAMIEYCETLINADMIFLNSTFSVFDFQQKNPGNLIINSSKAFMEADGLLDKFAGIIHIGVIDNANVSESLHFPTAVFTRPNDHFSRAFDTINFTEISNLITSPYMHVRNIEQLSSTGTDNTLVALLDERDPLHLYEAVQSFERVQEFFGDNISFQYCDFFRCQSLVQSMYVINFNQPVFALSIKQGQRSKFEPYMKLNPLPENILDFCKFHMLGIPLPEEKQVIKIPKLYAPEFIQTVGDYEHDVILFVASPSMKLYEECLQNTRILYQVFKSVPSVKFYEYNPFTEHVQGLEMPVSDKPQYSIWPALKQPHGSAFTASMSVNVIFENFLKLIEKKVSNDKILEMKQVLQDLLANQEK
ncbi:hypothetical protein TRFO_29008 [Tritrichomonas foetus]|uniref:Thioredoxin domain-containing protein n=1 Tax=Tritrichomonas foetus TaxID=1144522 RepID=A0A1J4JY12_9EUKA|nr:hypothetical protein TRFO_29008 [Tritrichomonas foetus]|eukprot:OHT03578.1 hypothetical protein TRFO_29008 [Tritrichomonas foetus]